MKHILPVGIALMLSACGRREPPAPTVLAGTWNAEISRGLLPWNRKTVRGRITLVNTRFPNCERSLARTTPDAPVCATYVRGPYTIPLDSLVTVADWSPWNGEMTAVVRVDGTVSLSIGECCDRGAIFARGRLHSDRIEGRWHQQLYAGGPGGRFRLRRAPRGTR
jgi:hypothetical protein